MRAPEIEWGPPACGTLPSCHYGRGSSDRGSCPSLGDISVEEGKSQCERSGLVLGPRSTLQTQPDAAVWWELDRATCGPCSLVQNTHLMVSIPLCRDGPHLSLSLPPTECFQPTSCPWGSGDGGRGEETETQASWTNAWVLSSLTPPPSPADAELPASRFMTSSLLISHWGPQIWFSIGGKALPSL